MLIYEFFRKKKKGFNVYNYVDRPDFTMKSQLDLLKIK